MRESKACFIFVSSTAGFPQVKVITVIAVCCLSSGDFHFLLHKSGAVKPVPFAQFCFVTFIGLFGRRCCICTDLPCFSNSLFIKIQCLTKLGSFADDFLNFNLRTYQFLITFPPLLSKDPHLIRFCTLIVFLITVIFFGVSGHFIMRQVMIAMTV